MLSLVVFSAFNNINICVKYYCMTPMFGELWSTHSIINKFKNLIKNKKIGQAQENCIFQLKKSTLLKKIISVGWVIISSI